MGNRIIAGVLGVLLASGFASAQTMTVNPGVLIAGGKAEITYSDPARAGDTITVVIDDGALPTTTYVEVQIQLDGAGNGSAAWTVPFWFMANFNAPGVVEVARPIESLPSDGG